MLGPRPALAVVSNVSRLGDIGCVEGGQLELEYIGIGTDSDFTTVAQLIAKSPTG